MNRYYKVALGAIGIIGAIALLAALVGGHNVAVLSPKGLVAHKEYHLIIIASLMTLIVVVPVFVMTFMITWKYRATNTNAKYTPDWDHHTGLETLWWGVPTALILVLGIMTWQSSHQLDPFRPIESDVPPVTIQVVALDWKWLFIYPEQGIATVNYVEFPVNTPIHLEVTGDAPMNSLWIPQLGGQIYAMAGMSTQLQLMADEPGSYRGSSANLSGKGFAGMNFVATSSTPYDFQQWVASTQKSAHKLGMAEYAALAKPSENNPQTFYALREPDLYNEVIMKYMSPGADSHMHTMIMPGSVAR